MAVIDKTGAALMVKTAVLLVPPPGVGLKTVMFFVPAVVKSVAGITAVSCVGETYVVALSVPLSLTLEPDTKLVPVTVIVN